MSTEPTTTPTDADDARTTAFLDAFATFMDTVNARAHRDTQPSGPTLDALLTDHLGAPARGLPVLTETVTMLRTADADVAISIVVDRQGGGPPVGIGGGGHRTHASLSEMVEQSARWQHFPVGPVDYVRVATGPEAERRLVAFGLHLFRYAGVPVAILQRSGSPRHGMEGALEVMSPDEESALALLAELRDTMLSHSVLRGQVFTFTSSEYGPTSGGVTFLPRTPIPAADVILPPGTLERAERQVLGVARHRSALLDAGQHLKRGVLLYGPPGTGKTHTVRYLIGASPDTTVILLAGTTLSLVGLAAQTARALQPAIVVLEDCDLIAEDRSFHDGPQPLLFEVLDAMDGLSADADVAFVLTTNRADLLERALAQRPGRVDLAVEIPLPDVDARRRLFDLYQGSLPFTPEALDDAAQRTAGVTASFVKEAIRRAVLRAAERDATVRDDDLATAITEMTDDAERITRSLLGGRPDGVPD